MSQRMKRVLHAVEEKQAGVWRVVWCGNDKGKAIEHSEAKPGTKVATYDRNEGALRPGKCLWVVEAGLLDVWSVEGVYTTLLKARAAMSEVTQQRYGWLPRKARLLRFVRRKERNW